MNPQNISTSLLAATDYIRAMRGGAQSHMLTANDGHAYVVKFANNPQSLRVLANERLWIVCEFDHISVTIIGSEHVRLRSTSHGTYVVRSGQKRCGYVLWIHLWLQEHARKVDKMARSDVARVQIRPRARQNPQTCA